MKTAKMISLEANPYLVKFVLKPEYKDLELNLGDEEVGEYLMTNSVLFMDMTGWGIMKNDSSKAFFDAFFIEEFGSMVVGRNFIVDQLTNGEDTIITDQNTGITTAKISSMIFATHPIVSMYERVIDPVV